MRKLSVFVTIIALLFPLSANADFIKNECNTTFYKNCLTSTSCTDLGGTFYWVNNSCQNLVTNSVSYVDTAAYQNGTGDQLNIVISELRAQTNLQNYYIHAFFLMFFLLFIIKLFQLVISIIRKNDKLLR
jgi:hypothetical protein